MKKFIVPVVILILVLFGTLFAGTYSPWGMYNRVNAKSDTLAVETFICTLIIAHEGIFDTIATLMLDADTIVSDSIDTDGIVFNWANGDTLRIYDEAVFIDTVTGNLLGSGLRAILELNQNIRPDSSGSSAYVIAPLYITATVDTQIGSETPLMYVIGAFEQIYDKNPDTTYWTRGIVLDIFKQNGYSQLIDGIDLNINNYGAVAADTPLVAQSVVLNLSVSNGSPARGGIIGTNSRGILLHHTNYDSINAMYGIDLLFNLDTLSRTGWVYGTRIMCNDTIKGIIHNDLQFLYIPAPTIAATGSVGGNLYGINVGEMLGATGENYSIKSEGDNYFETAFVNDSLAVDGVLYANDKVKAGTFESPIDVTSGGEYGFELHYSGNNYNVTGLRSRSQLITTDAPTKTSTGAIIQASNTNGINASVINGALIEAIGKSSTTGARIGTMRGLLVNTEWSAKDTITDMKILHLRTHTRDATGDGAVDGSIYGLYIENEAVGGNGQALDAAMYLKGTNISGGNYAYTYGIDFSGVATDIATADFRFRNGALVNNPDEDTLRITEAVTDIVGEALLDDATISTSFTVDGKSMFNDSVNLGDSIDKMIFTKASSAEFYDTTDTDNVSLWHDGTSFVLRDNTGTTNFKLEDMDFELQKGGLIQNPDSDTVAITATIMRVIGDVFVTENITADTFVGDGAQLTGIIIAISKSAIEESLNTGAVAITQAWEWDGGNITVADGQKIVVTDTSEADSTDLLDDGTNAILEFDNPFMMRGNYVRIGNAGTVSFVDGDGDLYVEDELEVDGAAVFGVGVTLGAGAVLLNDDIYLSLGGGLDGILQWDLTQTNDAFIMSSLGSNSIIFFDWQAFASHVDYGLAVQTNPTLFICSADTTDKTEWISVAYDGIDVGKGNVDILDGITQETYVIRKFVSLSGATDATPTNFFTITTTDEAASADGGMYSVTVHLTAGEATAASGAVNTASVSLVAHWTRIMASAGTGANSAVAEISESASANEGSGAISVVTLTVVETSEFVQTVQLDVNTSGGTFDGFALVELVYSDFTTPPVIQ